MSLFRENLKEYVKVFPGRKIHRWLSLDFQILFLFMLQIRLNGENLLKISFNKFISFRVIAAYELYFSFYFSICFFFFEIARSEDDKFDLCSIQKFTQLGIFSLFKIISEKFQSLDLFVKFRLAFKFLNRRKELSANKVKNLEILQDFLAFESVPFKPKI